MDDELTTLLRTSKIFSSLPKRAVRKLLPQFEKVELDKNEVLYYQGDPSESVELLLDGELVSVFTTVSGENKTVGDIFPGETVGELGALSGDPRATTIRAKKESILYKLPSEAFSAVCNQYPAVLFNLIKPVLSRSHQIIQTLSSEKFKRHIVVMPANDKVNVNDFAAKMHEHVSGLISLILISEYHLTEDTSARAKIQSIVDNAREKNIKRIKQKFIYLLKPNDTELAKYSTEKADMLYIIANSKDPSELSDYVKAQIKHFYETNKICPELILVHDKNTVLPKDTAKWLALTNFGLHHHIKIDRIKDYRRLIRFMRNKAVGLVLGGGGTRGWAHAGAIKALEEAGIPIDIICGTSVGAVIGSFYSINLSAEETLDDYRKIIEGSRGSVSWRNLTWPAISLFNAKGLTTIFQKLYGDIQIEDLWLPFSCISTNLAKNSETLHKEGTLWEKVRASVAIPGIIPPMIIDGELHFDGGLLNNLPVDVMRHTIGQRGTIIAVELSGNGGNHKYSFPPILTFWQAFLGKFGLAFDYKFPPFVDTFLKSLIVSSIVKSQQNSLIADLFVSVDLTSYPMLYSNKKVENKIVELGYETMMKQIKNMRLKGK